jgi:CRISPR/Cas system-associated protein Csx1
MASMDNISSHYIELAATQKLRYALQIAQANDELSEQLFSSLRWIVRYCKRYQIPLPEKERILASLDKVLEINNKIPCQAPTNLKQPDKTTEDGAIP